MTMSPHPEHRELRSRLDQLRRARGAINATAPASALSELPTEIASHLSPSLAQRLARLRPRASLGATRQGITAAAADIARLSNGELIAPQLVRVTERYPLPLKHGGMRLNLPTNGSASKSASGSASIFLDTETTGLAGGTGTVAFVVGLAAIDACALVVTQYLLLGFADEVALLEAVASHLGPDRRLVTFNGASFDLPLLRTRYRMHRLADPIPSCEHLDLLPWARRMRPDGWPNAKLKTIESLGLGFDRIDDLPGDQVPQTWRRWLQFGDGIALPKVLEHNRLDLVSLAALDELASNGIGFASSARRASETRKRQARLL
jgi:uncharacterized protein